MNCDSVTERLSALLDGELASEEEKAVRAHLDSCADCRHTLEQLREMVDAVKDAPPLRAPKGFRDQVMASVASERTERDRVSKARLLWPVAAAIIIASVLYLIDLGTRQREQARRGPPTVAMTRNRKTLKSEVAATYPGYTGETYLAPAPAPDRTARREMDTEGARIAEPLAEQAGRESGATGGTAADHRELVYGFKASVPAENAEKEARSTVDSIEAISDAPVAVTAPAATQPPPAPAMSLARSAAPVEALTAAAAEAKDETPPPVDIIVVTNNEERAYAQVRDWAARNNRDVLPVVEGTEKKVLAFTMSEGKQDAVSAGGQVAVSAPAKGGPVKSIALDVNTAEIVEIGNDLANAGLLGPSARSPFAKRRSLADNSDLIVSNMVVANDGDEFRALLDQQATQSQRQAAQFGMSSTTNFFFSTAPVVESQLDVKAEKAIPPAPVEK
jgi:hypothetical protein